jgi:hypothetical protein
MGEGAGKGDTPRPVDAKTYRDNYDRIFRKHGIIKPHPNDTRQGNQARKLRLKR